jgi:nucleoside-diphosphate-sugar epimerase
MRRYRAESMLQEWCSKSATRCIIFRVPGIYGPGRLGIDRISAGAAFIRESDANPGNRIHADDLANASIAALKCNIPGGIYNICDGDHRSGTWFAQTVARLAGLPAPHLISRADALRTLSASRLSFLTESRRLDTQKMLDVLGFKPRFQDAEDGIRASLRETGLLRT